MTSKPSALLFVLLIGLGAGFAIAVYLQERGGPDPAPTGPNAQRKILYWVAPMDPNFRRDRPGKSPMDMDLVPVYDEPGAVPGGDVVVIGPEVVNNVGVRTAEAKIEQLNVPVRTVGRVTFDEEKVAHIHLRSNGWIQRLSVRAEGE
ncbi:MAG TPA: efflux RND transporter periplasmic adaptor subunit, partial [Gammaproteobacteria bacterium]|nr:efflux RND transporter periplasmic adaptor subunit [Gammaproteobacteria bacterium]